MKKKFNLEAFSTGLAMFSMFFGAGNVIFPLAVGQYAGDKNFFAIWGLILTAALMPIAGVIAMVLFDGNYKEFFGRLGKKAGFFLSLLIISLLGPLGSTPRCIVLSYTTLSLSFLDLSPTFFSALACAVIFLFTVRKSQILKILGFILTPLLLLSLVSIVIVGLLTKPDFQASELGKTHLFFHGLKEGYNTMDLLAAFFFSSTILSLLKLQKKQAEHPLKITFHASLLAAFLLSLIYVGFSYLASFHGKDLIIASQDELLSAIIMKIAGPYAGHLVCICVVLACLTTAIALITSFTDFFQKEVLKEKVSYEITLFGALFVTFLISSLKFTGISAFLAPILQICYPGLIVFTFLNILFRLKNFKPVKAPVYTVFALSALSYLTTL